MLKNLYISLLAVSLAIAVSPVNAADPVALEKTSFNDLRDVFTLATSDSSNVAALKTSAHIPVDRLQLVRQHTDNHKITHVRMQQEYAGFLVFGGYAIMHSKEPAKTLLNAKNEVTMNGVVYRGLKTELGQPAPLFVERADIALQELKSQYKRYPISDEQAIPMVYIDSKHRAFWAYKVSFLVSHDDRIPERPTAIIDAQTFKPLIEWNSLKTSRSEVNGIGFGGNSQTGQYQFGKDLPALMMRRDNSAMTCYMENKNVKVVDMVHKYGGANIAMQFSCGEGDPLSTNTYWTGYQNDGYDLENGAYSPTNDALYAGQVIYNMYKDWYDVNVLKTWWGNPMQLVMRVHYGQGYENAFWDGETMTFGDGDTMMYPLVSLGIGAHEISHGFTEQHADLEYFGQSGGMNESFSDMAAQAAEFYSQGKSSWAIGAEIMKEESGYKALRFMDEPSRDGKSIDRADQYKEGLNVHYSSGVYNRLFYILANQPQWDVKQAFYVMIKANMDYWTPYSTFNEGGCGVISAAHDLDLSVDDVKQALDEVAIDYKICGK